MKLRITERLKNWRQQVVSVPPIQSVRGATIGMFWAFTPTIGVQIPLIVAQWLILKRRYPFSLPVAIGCTFVTNFVTMGPVYYMFLVTGRLILGRIDRIRGYGTFSERIATTGEPGMSGTFTAMLNVWLEFGLPLFVGSMPWAITIATATYLLMRRWLITKPAE